jgi:hypothetical protein
VGGGGRYALAYLVEALCYSPEGGGFESRLDGFFFNRPNSSSRTKDLGSPQLQTEISTKYTPVGKGRPMR